jgi:hypothetical protein
MFKYFKLAATAKPVRSGARAVPSGGQVTRMRSKGRPEGQLGVRCDPVESPP